MNYFYGIILDCGKLQQCLIQVEFARTQALKSLWIQSSLRSSPTETFSVEEKRLYSHAKCAHKNVFC